MVLPLTVVFCSLMAADNASQLTKGGVKAYSEVEMEIPL